MGKSGGGLLGLALAVLLPAAVGALVALSVVRLRGIFLALATLAFAQAMDKVFFLHALGYGGTLAVPRPFGLKDDSAYFVFLAAVLALGCVGVLEVRRHAFGRRLIALNDSPAASATMGVSPTVTRLVVFAMASGVAGLGGALFGGLNGQVSNNDFLLLSSCVLLLLATLGGLYTPSGVVVFALFYALFPVLQVHVPQLGQVQYLLTGLGVLTLGRNRYGLGGQLAELGERLRGVRVERVEVARAAG
jgi:branched-chain amino acid transport system permease protein